MTAYTMEYATCTRASIVSVRAAPWSTLVEAGRIPGAGDPDRLARFVLHDPSGQRHAIRTRTTLDVLEGISLSDGRLRGIGLVAEWGVILGDADRRWDGLTLDGFENYNERSLRFDTRLTSGGHQLAVRLMGDHWTSVVQEHPSLQAAPSVRIVSDNGPTRWIDVVPGSGVAAIGDDGRVFVALDDGRMRMYASDGDVEDLRGKARVDVILDDVATHASAFGDACVLLSRRGAGTRVRWIEPTGSVRWETMVPFEAHQPAIDGGGGRVYIAGEGLAAIDNGRLTWSTSAHRLRATATTDGLAVAAGTELQFVAPDGSLVRRFVTPIAAALLTPPAIDPHGHAWVASSDQLWVTR